MKRYSITIGAYVYADNREQAIERCKEYKHALEQVDDCRPALFSLIESPIGEINN